MAEIQFDLGKNIVDTAKASGVPQFSTDNVNGYISYSVNGIQSVIPARFTRPGLEITWQPLFAFTLRADEKRFPDRRVQTAVLQLDNKITTDEAAQAFVEQTIAQFRKGKWKRYADPTFEVMLTGRSSLLDESGQLDTGVTGSPDPDYRIPKDEWPTLASSLYFYWSGDGVLAQLSVNNSPGVDGKPAYSMSLRFDLLEAKLKRDAENEAQRLKDGDAKGWDSTAKSKANEIKRTLLIKRLIANAVKRGDQVVTP